MNAADFPRHQRTLRVVRLVLETAALISILCVLAGWLLIAF